MRMRVVFPTLAVCLAAWITAVSAGPRNDDQSAVFNNPRPTAYSIIQDGDRDGYFSSLDCNDDNALIHPRAVETLNGFDDDCNGAVDDGFDTIAEYSRLATTRQLWPDNKARLPLEGLDLETGQPRLIWTGSMFVAVWSDRGDRLRLARISPEGVLAAGLPLTLREKARLPDATWTGSRVGVVYEDRSNDQPSVRLMVLDPTGRQLMDTLLGDGRQPRIAWGQDRFGVVWVRSSCLNDCIVFARFDRQGLPIGPIEPLEFSGGNPAISWSGTGIDLSPIEGAVYAGSFGIAYDASYDFAATGGVLLTSRSLEPFQSASTVRVNMHEDPPTKLAGMPSVASNASGFAVSWHAEMDTFDRVCSRAFSLDRLEPVQEFMPDGDAARSSRILWTGGEYVMVTDNLIKDTTDVHLRRLDLSGNSHQAAEWGPWAEVNVSRAIGTANSVHPYVANTGRGFGVIWIEQEGSNSYGRLYLASVVHN